MKLVVVQHHVTPLHCVVRNVNTDRARRYAVVSTTPRWELTCVVYLQSSLTSPPPHALHENYNIHALYARIDKPTRPPLLTGGSSLWAGLNLVHTYVRTRVGSIPAAEAAVPYTSHQASGAKSKFRISRWAGAVCGLREGRSGVGREGGTERGGGGGAVQVREKVRRGFGM